MKVKLFITSSLGLVGTWLALAYTHQVDMETYPRLGKGSMPLIGDLSNPLPDSPQKPSEETSTVGK